MSPQHKPADDVRVVAGLKEAFLKRHRKDAARARNAWAALVAKHGLLLRDTDHGEHFAPPRVPAPLRGLPVLYVIKGLPGAFRAVYSVFKDPRVGLVVQIEWIGDQAAYDKAFGYSTS